MREIKKGVLYEEITDITALLGDGAVYDAVDDMGSR